MGDSGGFKEKPVAWFKHPTSPPENIKAIAEMRGMKDYGRFWLLVEMIGNQESKALPYEDSFLNKYFSSKLEFENEADFDDFIEYLLDLGALENKGNGLIVSPMIQESRDYMLNQQIAGRKGGLSKANRTKGRK